MQDESKNRYDEECKDWNSFWCRNIREYTFWQEMHDDMYTGGLKGNKMHVDGTPTLIAHQNGRVMEVTAHMSPDGLLHCVDFQIGESEFSVHPAILLDAIAKSAYYKDTVVELLEWWLEQNKDKEVEEVKNVEPNKL